MNLARHGSLTCFTFLSAFPFFFFPDYRYTTSPHLFNEKAKEAFARVRNKVCVHFLFEGRCCLVLSIDIGNIPIRSPHNWSAFYMSHI